MAFCHAFTRLLIAALLVYTPAFAKGKSKTSRQQHQPATAASVVEPEAPLSPPPTQATPEIKKIRVLLDEFDLADDPHLVIQGKHDSILSCPAEENEGVLFEGENINILCAENRLYLQCSDGKHRRLKHNSLEIANPHHRLTVGGKTYHGNIIIRLDEENKKVLIINKVPLEDYVCSVVRYECVPTWPFEMQKLQAIISRTYAAYQMTLARSSHPFYKYYDIRNTNLHQVYNGTHTLTRIRQAVEETQDLVLTYNGKIALTMFDICCGGSVPALMRCKDTTKPYLMRSQKCIYCPQSQHYRWQLDLHHKTFLDKLLADGATKQKLDGIKQIKEIKVVDADKAGVVHKVSIVGTNNKRVLLSGRDIRRPLSIRVRSLNYTIKKINDRIVIQGKGDGHQKGVCQVGCRELLKRGWSMQRVLQFYYPGTALSRLV